MIKLKSGLVIVEGSGFEIVCFNSAEARLMWPNTHMLRIVNRFHKPLKLNASHR